MDVREFDLLILDTLPPDGRASLEKCVDEIVEEEGFGESPAHMRAAAQAFNQKGCDESLPIDKQLVAHQIAAALRLRAEGSLN
jgi:hypothetical protein